MRIWILLITFLGLTSSASSGSAAGESSSIFHRQIRFGGHSTPLYRVFLSKGIPKAPLEEAFAAYDHYKKLVKNRDVITIVQSQCSLREKCFWVLDLKTGEVKRMAVSHGYASDVDGVAVHFSDQFDAVGTHKTSLGLYLTEQSYVGMFGYSLRLKGLSRTNQNAEARAILVHGYAVGDDYRQADCQAAEAAKGTTGHPDWCLAEGELDEGCFGVPQAFSRAVIDRIQGGSLLLSYSGS